MLEAIVDILLNLLTVLVMLGGLAFMLIGALGLIRFPDIYARSHAASKCVTLGVVGLLAALIFFTIGSGGRDGQDVTTAVTKAVLVVAFVFVAAPLSSHVLARAAHIARNRAWDGTLSDELEEDHHGPTA
jgi:multicomponent Na+:H+ antiporter subunit G